MGSRLKGNRAHKSNKMDRRIIFKLVIYGIVGVAVIALLWGLWLSKTGLEKIEQMKAQRAASRTIDH